MEYKSMKDKKIAVTGAAGLIGSFLVDHLVAIGADVVAIDDLSKGRKEHLATSLDRIDLRVGDLEDVAFASEVLAGAEVVFHLASRAYGVGYSSKNHWAMLEHNERLNNSVLFALAKNPPQALLVTSSSCVYPDDGPDTVAELPLFTGEPEAVNRGYGWAKRFLEQKAVLFAEQTGVPVTIVRPFNIYGERYTWLEGASQAIPMLVKRILDGENPVVVWGSGRQRRTYVHAQDCAKLMMELVMRGVCDGPVNIGFEETVSMAELTQTIARVASLEPELQFDTTKPEGRFIKSADSTRLRTVLPDLELTVDLETGLRRMVGWYEETFGVRKGAGVAHG